MQLLGRFLIELQNPPGLLVCGQGLSAINENDGWISLADPGTIYWVVDDIMLLDMPFFGHA
jgi:hypothetical protein